MVKPVSSQFTYNGKTIAWGAWAIVLLIFSGLMQYITRAQAIERSVQVRTAELSAANTALESEITERTRVTVEALRSPVA